MVFHAFWDKDFLNSLAVVKCILSNYFQGLPKGYPVKVNAALECPGADNGAGRWDMDGLKLPAVHKGRFPYEEEALWELYSNHLPAFGKGAFAYVSDCGGKMDLLKIRTALFQGDFLTKLNIGHIILEGKDAVTDNPAAVFDRYFTWEILCVQELCAVLRVAETVFVVPEVPLKLLLRRRCGDCQNIRDGHLEILYVLDVFLQHYLGFHLCHFLEKLELVCGGEIYLVLILAFTPPLVECDGVCVIGNAGLYLRAETGS